MFNGTNDSKPSHWQYTKILQYFLKYHINTWRRDKDMIMNDGSFMKNTTGDWFDAQDMQMQTLWIID